MVDAYQDITIPFQMSSREFFSMVKEHLKDDGVMVVNMNMYSEELDSSNPTINTYLADTISSVFENVAIVDVVDSTNKELFASNNAHYLDKLSANAAVEENESLRAMMDRVEQTALFYDAGTNVMTDDKAPVELLGMKQIDLIIKDEVSYYKGIYNSQGISGLINSF